MQKYTGTAEILFTCIFINLIYKIKLITGKNKINIKGEVENNYAHKITHFSYAQFLYSKW